MLTDAGEQVDKVVQLYEVMLTRHTTMVVGQTGGGKSVILQMLARAQVCLLGGRWPGQVPAVLIAQLGIQPRRLCRATGHARTHTAHTIAAPCEQARMGRKTALSVLNPKAISVAELYGVLDKDTRDWTDGLLSSIFR